MSTWRVSGFECLVQVASVGMLLITGKAEAATYYVATTGSDSYSCAAAQASSTPKRTITAALKCIGTAEGAGAGKTVVVADGVYDEIIRNVPGGTSWSAPFTLKAATPRRATIRYPGPPANPDKEQLIRIAGATAHHLIIEGFLIDGNHAAWDAVKITLASTTSSANTWAHHVRLLNNEIRDALHQGVIAGCWMEAAASNLNDCHNEYLKNDVHGHGSNDFDHGFYICGGSNLVEGNRIYDNYGFGGKFECGTTTPTTVVSRNILRQNVIFNNSRVGTRGGWVVGDGSGNRLYNNIIYGNRLGIHIFSNGSGNLIDHNTIVNNNRSSSGGKNCIIAGPGTSLNVVRNNLCDGHEGADFVFPAGSIALASHNLCTGHPSCVVTTDPKFVNAAAHDFHLTSTSPAVNAGVTLPEVPQDFECTPRPQGSGWDIGADEFGPPGSSCSGPPSLPGDLNGDGVRNLTDVRWLIEMLVGSRVKTTAADLDRDGDVDLADCQALIRLLVTP